MCRTPQWFLQGCRRRRPEVPGVICTAHILVVGPIYSVTAVINIDYESYSDRNGWHIMNKFLSIYLLSSCRDPNCQTCFSPDVASSDPTGQNLLGNFELDKFSILSLVNLQCNWFRIFSGGTSGGTFFIGLFGMDFLRERCFKKYPLCFCIVK